MLLHPRIVFHVEESQPVVPRVGARVGLDGAALEMADQLQNAAEAECNAVLEDAHRLGAQHFGIPARSLLKVAARHRDMGDVAPRGRRGVVEKPLGRLKRRGGLESDVVQSVLIPASRTTWAHLRSSRFTTRSSSSGEEPTVSPPCSRSLCFTSGSWMVRATSFCMRAMIAGGVFAGANSAYHESTS